MLHSFLLTGKYSKSYEQVAFPIENVDNIDIMNGQNGQRVLPIPLNENDTTGRETDQGI